MSKMLLLMTSKDTRFAVSDLAIQDFYDKWPEYAETVEIKKLHDNMLPLPAVYNDVLNDMKDYDFVVFMHADVNVRLVDLVMDIERCKDKYDVMGLCGCSKLSVSESPLNWFTGSKLFPESRWGYVCHGENGNAVSFFSKHSPEVKDHEAACIDGLCIIVSKHAAEAGLRFGDEFSYDCYDTDFSLSAVMKYGLRLGVLVEKTLHHYSVGKSILTDTFLMTELLMRKKHNLGIPKGSRLEQLTSASLQ